MYKMKLSSPASVLEDYEDWESYIASFTKVLQTENIPNPPFNGVIDSDEILNKALSIAWLQHSPHEVYLHNKFQTKWKCYQGGTISFPQLKSKLDEYYLKRKVKILHLSNLFDLALNFIFNKENNPECYIPHRRRILTQQDSVYLFHKYKANHRSDGGIVYKGDRRDRENVVTCLRRAFVYPMRLDKLISNGRYKDSKYRNIFNNDLANFFKENIALSFFFDWINKYQSVDNYPEETISEMLCILSPKDAYGGDLEAMDQKMNYPANSCMLHKLMNRLGYSQSEKEYVSKFLFSFFSTELLVGDEIWAGIHNLFSGVGPTHDLENIQNFLINLAGIITFGMKPVLTCRRLKRNEAFVFVKGDDHLVVFGRKLSTEEHSKFGNIMKNCWDAAGQVLNLEKTMWSDTAIEYCKHMYAINNNVSGFKKVPGKILSEIPHSIYSIEKAIWNLRYPESMPKFNDKRMLFFWFCVHMDCAFGSVGWNNAVSYLVAHFPDSGFVLDLDYRPSKEDLDKMNKDWWFEHCGFTDIQSSKTYQYVKNLLVRL